MVEVEESRIAFGVSLKRYESYKTFSIKRDREAKAQSKEDQTCYSRLRFIIRMDTEEFDLLTYQINEDDQRHRLQPRYDTFVAKVLSCEAIYENVSVSINIFRVDSKKRVQPELITTIPITEHLNVSPRVKARRPPYVILTYDTNTSEVMAQHDYQLQFRSDTAMMKFVEKVVQEIRNTDASVASSSSSSSPTSTAGDDAASAEYDAGSEREPGGVSDSTSPSPLPLPLPLVEDVLIVPSQSVGYVGPHPSPCGEGDESSESPEIVSLDGEGNSATDTDTPIWVFGKSYSYNRQYALDDLRRTVESCIWLTHRTNFHPISPTNMTSDNGWGGMIRCGQMMIAKSLLLRHLLPDWYWNQPEPTVDHRRYLEVLYLFEDTPTALLSIHEIARSVALLRKPIGSWLGPNTVAQALKRLLSAPSAAPVHLEMVIAMDLNLVKSEVKRACFKEQMRSEGTKNDKGEFPSTSSVPVFGSASSQWKPLVLVVPLRLGLSELNPKYVPALRSVFQVRQNIGVLGGKPDAALYFIGYADDEVLFLDPHTVQPAAAMGWKHNGTQMEFQSDASYHNSKPGRMPFSAMDPSLAVCFYCGTEQDFDELCTQLLDKWSIVRLPLFQIVRIDLPIGGQHSRFPWHMTNTRLGHK